MPPEAALHWPLPWLQPESDCYASWSRPSSPLGSNQFYQVSGGRTELFSFSISLSWRERGVVSFKFHTFSPQTIQFSTGIIEAPLNCTLLARAVVDCLRILVAGANKLAWFIGPPTGAVKGARYCREVWKTGGLASSWLPEPVEIETASASGTGVKDVCDIDIDCSDPDWLLEPVEIEPVDASDTDIKDICAVGTDSSDPDWRLEAVGIEQVNASDTDIKDTCAIGIDSSDPNSMLEAVEIGQVDASDTDIRDTCVVDIDSSDPKLLLEPVEFELVEVDTGAKDACASGLNRFDPDWLLHRAWVAEGWRTERGTTLTSTTRERAADAAVGLMNEGRGDMRSVIQ